MHAPQQPRNSFSKEERLCSRKVLDELFEKGHFIQQHPFRLIWMERPPDEKFPVQLAVSAPKRRMKLAHDRNRMKRLMREAWRKNKHELISWCRQNGKGFSLLLIAQCNTPPSYHLSEEKIILLLRRLMKENARAAG